MVPELVLLASMSTCRSGGGGGAAAVELGHARWYVLGCAWCW
jgi:hypothetical protein